MDTSVKYCKALELFLEERLNLLHNIYAVVAEEAGANSKRCIKGKPRKFMAHV